MFNLWEITSYEDYLTWPSVANKFTYLTNYQKSLGYISPKDFFDKNAFQAQSLANDRIGSTIGRLFLTKDLPPKVQLELKNFTYRAMDHLRLNDTHVSQTDRQSSTSYNNGRTDSTQLPGYSNIESVLGAPAWRAWNNSKIEKIYISYVKDADPDYLLDPNMFFNKDQINEFFTEIDKKIEYEHEYTNFKTTSLKLELDNLSNNKANRKDHKLLVQELDENANPIDSPKELGYFDEILILSHKSDSIIVDTQNNKKRAIVNLNESLGEITGAQIFQTPSETDHKNAIGRIWAYGQENTINKLKDKDKEINKRINKLFVKGELIKSVQMLRKELKQGWIKNQEYSHDTNLFSQEYGTNKINNLRFLREDLLTENLSILTNQHTISFKTAGIWKKVENWDGYFDINYISGYNGYLFEWIMGAAKFGLTIEDIKKTKYKRFKNNIFIDGNKDNETFFEVPFSVWEYVGIDENGNTNKYSINFSMPFFEKQNQEKQQRIAREAKLTSLVTKAELEPIKKDLQIIKPTVEELHAKEQHRIKTLGIDPNNKYWKDGDKDE